MWAGTGSPVDTKSLSPSRNTTSTSGSGAVRNYRPSPTSYPLRVRASTDSRLCPCGIPCSQHLPPICVFLPSPADPSLHNSESMRKIVKLVCCDSSCIHLKLLMEGVILIYDFAVAIEKLLQGRFEDTNVFLDDINAIIYRVRALFRDTHRRESSGQECT